MALATSCNDGNCIGQCKIKTEILGVGINDGKMQEFVEQLKKEGGAGEETRTLTPKAPEPKSGASTNFATPARLYT